jgi:hypothetical protein
MVGGNQPVPGPQRRIFDLQDPPARAPGPLGVNDRADPDSPSNVWDNPLTGAAAGSEFPLGDVDPRPRQEEVQEAAWELSSGWSRQQHRELG